MKKILIGFLLTIGITAIAGSFTDVTPGQSITSSIFNAIQQTVDGILEIDVPTGQNVYTARINAGAYVESTGIDFITNVTESGGTYTVTFKNEEFTVTPAIQITLDLDGTNWMMSPTYSSVSKDQVSLHMHRFATAHDKISRHFTLSVIKQGDDYNPYKSIREILEEVGIL